MLLVLNDNRHGRHAERRRRDAVPDSDASRGIGTVRIHPRNGSADAQHDRDRMCTVAQGLLTGSHPTRLPPAGDDEVTSTKTIVLPHGVTSCSAGHSERSALNGSRRRCEQRHPSRTRSRGQTTWDIYASLLRHGLNTQRRFVYARGGREPPAKGAHIVCRIVWQH